jgi:hypothetical protein
MSHFGRAVPVTCRRFPELEVHSLAGDRKFLPEISAQHVVLLFRPAHVHALRAWLPLFGDFRSTTVLFVIAPRWRPLHGLWRWRCGRWKNSECPEISDHHVGAVYEDRKTLLDSLGLLNPEISNFVLSGDRDIEAAWQGPRLPQSASEVKKAIDRFQLSYIFLRTESGRFTCKLTYLVHLIDWR